MALPDVVSREHWLQARLSLLDQEKDLTRLRDRLNADRRRLPMVRIEKEYLFEGPEGMAGLKDLFDGSPQLMVQHVMFGPDWEQPCPSCSWAISGMTPSMFSGLRTRKTTFVLVSRAPYARISEAREQRGWDVPWFSSYGSDFNYDFEVSVDKTGVKEPRYNYRDEPELRGADAPTELPGVSCFLRDGDEVFHTYSSFARGVEFNGSLYPLLDLTALGRQEEWEEPKDRVEASRGAVPTFDE
jgi:predicted dithiol-disulfide oxidoreductase (DUF899 family)